MKTLLIDDEQAILVALGNYLEDMDFDVVTAENGRLGLEALEEHDPDIVVVDLTMPVMDGYAFIREVAPSHPTLPIVVLSGVGLIDQAMEAVRLGAWDFVPKPVEDMGFLLHIINKSLEKAQLIKENIHYQKHLEDLVQERTAQLQHSKRLILNCLGKAAEFKDNETGMHVLRVGNFSYTLGKGLGLEQAFCEQLRDASPMHDVGKIGIADSVLLKPGKLDAEEWEHMKQHVNFGCAILSPAGYNYSPGECSPDCLLSENEPNDLLSMAKRIALFHHERYDGKGYPFQLAGDRIPIEARIVSVADVYDAVSSKRPYKEPFPEEHCQDIIRQGAGTQFDPAVVDSFFDNIEAVLEIKEKYKD